MGQFSWLTKTGEQIRNEYHQGQKVWMAFKSDDGANVVVKENQYKGYGVFGGVDYYETVFHMNQSIIPNKLDQDQRSIGIDICYNDICLEGKPQFPQLFTHEPSIEEIAQIDWFEPNPDDPNQGWVVEDDNDNYEWNGIIDWYKEED